MLFPVKIRPASFIIVKIFFIFSFLIIVKSPNTFSEARMMMNGNSKVTISGVQAENITINGKTFSFFMQKPSAPLPKVNKILLPETTAFPSTDIRSKGNLTAQMLSEFLLNNNPALNPDYALRLATVYKEEASDEGINTDVAFSQMCLETGFLKYGGDVSPGQNNFCGLGVTGRGVKGISFTDMRSGVRAHIQHLKAYASRAKLNNPLVDSRFNFVKRGSATNVNQLTGKWATDKNYDKKIISLLKKMYTVAKS